MVQRYVYTDQELVTLLKAGEEDAFTEIYNRYWKRIYAHVFKMLRDEESTKDVIQEVFGNLWLKASQIKDGANIPGLLYIAARNKVFDLIEKQKVRNDYLSEIAHFVSDLGTQPVDTIDETKIREILENEILNLPSKMREIFELSRMDGLSHKEIATKLGLSEQTVKKQVQNALKKIKPKFRDIGLSVTILFLLR